MFWTVLKLLLEVLVGSTLDDCKALLVRRWGEMGGYWGINRTMAEMHALLFVANRPLCTDDIMQLLHVSRGNASMNLRALVDWGLIQRVHQLGDRKEYFQADTDVWHMFETIMRERRRREVEPILQSIERCRRMIPAPGPGGAGPSPDELHAFACRLDELQRFLNTMGTLFELVLRFGSDGVNHLMQMATAAAAVLEPVAAPSPAAAPARTRASRGRPRATPTRTRKSSP
jgi:predicted transcriptional regulator